MRLSPDGADISPIWGYEGAAPGPLLRVGRGEELRVRLINAHPASTAIHWHGVRMPNLMDGVPGLTQAAVAPGATFDYRFQPPAAGTFWYHTPWPLPATPAAEAEPASRQRLYGALIVEEAPPPAVDREHVLVFDDWPMAAGKPEDPSAFQILTNGTPVPKLAVRANARVRLRLINSARARGIALRLDRHVANVMALDGQPADPFRARDNRLVLAPGPSTLPQPARFSVKRGRAVMLGLVNRQEFACAVHVHGHAFRLLDRLDDGWKPFWLATVLVDAKQTVRIAFLVDNPGKWLIECVGIDPPGSVTGGWFEVT
jgi:FtsP/CotA-like multicopper oxidase with cupredoxin domain